MYLIRTGVFILNWFFISLSSYFILFYRTVLGYALFLLLLASLATNKIYTVIAVILSVKYTYAEFKIGDRLEYKWSSPNHIVMLILLWEITGNCKGQNFPLIIMPNWLFYSVSFYQRHCFVSQMVSLQIMTVGWPSWNLTGLRKSKLTAGFVQGSIM